MNLKKWPQLTEKLYKNARYLWVVIVVMVIAGSLMPHAGPPAKIDKVLHFILYICLACVPIVSFNNRKTAFLLGVAMAPMGYLLELGQGFVPGRTFSPEDMMANNLGVIIGLVIGGVWRLKRHYTRGTPVSHDERLSQKRHAS